MIQDSVLKLVQPGEFSDPLTEILRNGARALLVQAIDAEVAAFLGSHADKRSEDGRQRLVRHGHLPPERDTRPSRLCLAATRVGCPPQPSRGSRTPGQRSMPVGRSAISPPNAMSISGPMAFTCRLASRMIFPRFGGRG